VFLDDVVNFHTFNVVNTEKKFDVENNLFMDFKQYADYEQYCTATAVEEFSDDLIEAMSGAFKFVRDYDHFIMNRDFFEKNENGFYKKFKNQLTILAWLDLEKYIGLDMTFMANDFENTLIYKGNASLFEKVELSGVRKRTVPVNDRLKVYYFSDKRLSRDYRNKNQEKVEMVIKWINNNVEDYYYTANTDNKDVLNGTYIKPVSRGINDYQEYTKCVWLASMKPAPVESRLLQLKFDIDRTAVVQAREMENLYQFINRSNLRDYSSERIVEVYVLIRNRLNI